MHRYHHAAAAAATLCVTILVTAGCASTGGAGPSPDVAPPATTLDVRDEVGANGLPTPNALLARYVDALGGEVALRRHESSTRKGKMSIAAMGMEGATTVHAAAPDRMVMNIETGMGAMNQGFNGKVGWSDNPMTGAQVLAGDQLANMKQQADFYMPLNYTRHFTSMETVEETDFNGAAAYKVRLVSSTGREALHFFDRSSSLLIGIQGVQDGPMGESEVKISFSDYKDFGGVKMPAKTLIDVAGMQIEQTVDTVTYDDVDASAFEPPEAVRAQLK
ncbi:MAG TPA: hypothetical protein VMS86_01230 [Thermoanaerobaculia bacterium]|nr:hypothetical protein [Thermoanaerobaculia bacterium]